jgi:epoxyqueuosine reductase
MMPNLTKARVRAVALDLGFDACRFTTAEAPPHAAFFRRWLAQGFHAGMQWLARQEELRCDPRQVLPSVRTIVLLAASYHGTKDLSPDVGGEWGGARSLTAGGQIARYARFQDYHELLNGPLASLARFIDEGGGTAGGSLALVDSGPLMERDLAQRAGLGFIGKHTNLIGRDLGNWFFIAAVLTPLEFEPDPPEVNHCGNCARCLAACPTGALPAPFHLDARRCIAYLTIENKGPIPAELRPLIGNHIFGCDDCLDVCPWNRFAREGRILRRQVAPGTVALPTLLALSEPEFKRRFRDTPILRAKWKGFLRNVCVALGNGAGAEALPALAQARASAEPLVAEHAAWAIQRIEGRLAAET